MAKKLVHAEPTSISGQYKLEDVTDMQGVVHLTLHCMSVQQPVQDFTGEKWSSYCSEHGEFDLQY